MWTKVLNLIIAVALISIVVGIQQTAIQKIDPAKMPELDLYYVPSPKYLKLISGGFDAAAADIYWIKTVLYFGARATRADYPMIAEQLTEEGKESPEYVEWKKDADIRYRYLADLVNTVVELDPYFVTPYLFGGLIISMKSGKPDESIELLEKGKDLFKERWQFPYLLGYNYYFYKEDFSKAVENFMSAAELPGSPTVVNTFVAGILKKTGKREIAIGFVEDLIERAEDPDLKEEMEKVLEELQHAPADTLKIKK